MKISKITLSVIAFAITFVFFSFTMPAGVTLIDSGELAMVAKNFGIAHPTGYPLYSILAGLFVRILPVQTILATNIFSIVFGAGAVVVFYLILVTFDPKLKKHFIAFSTAIACGLSMTFWNVSIETEVYSLEIFLDFLAIFTLILGLKKIRWLYLTAFIIGLAFGNHMHTVLYIPALIFLVIVNYKSFHLKLKHFMYMIIPFLLGLSVYLYLPFRAAAKPLPNWGNPDNIERIIRHVSGWQYRVWMFENNSTILMNNLKNFWNLLSSQNGILLSFASIVGIFFLTINKKWKILFFWLILALTDVLYSINYGITDIESYFIPAFIAAYMLFAFGLMSLKGKKVTTYGAVLAGLLMVSSMITNYSKCDKSSFDLPDRMANSIFASTAKNSIVFLDNWDVFAPTRYLQYEYGIRKDLAFIDFLLLKRSWYVEELLREYPEYFESSKREINNFIKEVTPFEQRKKHNPTRIESAYRKMIFSIIDNSLRRGRNVYSFIRWQPLNERYKSVPEGMLFKYDFDVPEYRHVPVGFYDWNYFESLKSLDSQRLRTMYSMVDIVLSTRVEYLVMLGKYTEAIENFRILFQLHPNETKYYKQLASLYIYTGDLHKAQNCYKFIGQEAPMDLLMEERAKFLKSKMNKDSL